MMDQSVPILEKYAKDRGKIQLLRISHSGIVKALNAGLSLARGEFVARMDADDISLPERLSKQVEYMTSHPECVALGTNVASIDCMGNVTRIWSLPVAHAEIDARYLNGRPDGIVHASSIFRRQVLQKVGGYREGFVAAEDADLFLRLAESGTLANLEGEVLYLYRMVSSSVTHTYSKQSLLSSCLAALDAYKRRSLDPRWDLLFQVGVYALGLRKYHIAWDYLCVSAGSFIRFGGMAHWMAIAEGLFPPSTTQKKLDNTTRVYRGFFRRSVICLGRIVIFIRSKLV
jgi:glycosyltransferase involved in cell wall biosynthesis